LQKWEEWVLISVRNDGRSLLAQVFLQRLKTRTHIGIIPATTSMKVWVASFPRSGNKFCRTVLRSVFGVPSSTMYVPQHKHVLSAANQDVSITQTDAGHETGGFSFVKTHELPEAGDSSPAIYVLRDGRDSYVSYTHYTLRKTPDAVDRPFYELMRMLVASQEHFGGWSAHVNSWTKRDAPTVIVRYEDLLRDAAGTVSAACTHLGITLPEAGGQMPAFAELHEKKPHIYRKGVSGSWRDEMPPDIEALFWEQHGGTMTRMGYTR
jgi:hypothetical protein